MQRLLPIGIQDFSTLIEENYLYVDKTMCILDIIENGYAYFLSRPQGFGKSLLLSTLHEIFVGNRQLFKDLYIDQSTYNWTAHSVIHLSFASLKVDSADDLKRALERILAHEAASRGVDIQDAPSLKTKFTALIKRVAQKGDVVILIDDYDCPMITNIAKPTVAQECMEVLQDFLVILKDLSASIRFIFITGETRFSTTSPFSGLNNLNDLTLKQRGEALLGFTHDEVRYYFDSSLKAIAGEQSSSLEAIMGQLSEWYNGFVFTDRLEKEPVKLYNPTSLLMYLKEGTLLNYWAETHDPSRFRYLIEHQKYPISDMEGAEVNCIETVVHDTLEMPLTVLFWQAGYLTIDSYDRATHNYRLRYPNKEVRDYFRSHVLPSSAPNGV
jgi:Predicted AAA-ATPase